MSTLTATARLAAKNDLARLIDDLMAFIRRYCVVTDHERLIIAVWIIHTYCIGPDEPFQTPYLNITSPVPGSGKSLLLRLLKVLAKDVQLAASISGAAMKRMIDEEAPVLLIDELDAFLGGNKERAETVRGILNSGFERDGRFIDCEGCSAPEFLDSGLTVFASTLPRPARRGRVGPGRDFDSRISPASTVRCMSA